MIYFPFLIVYIFLYRVSKGHMDQLRLRDMTGIQSYWKHQFCERDSASFSVLVVLKNAVVTRASIDGFQFCLRFLIFHNCRYHMSKGHIDQWIFRYITGSAKLYKKHDLYVLKYLLCYPRNAHAIIFFYFPRFWLSNYNLLWYVN